MFILTILSLAVAITTLFVPMPVMAADSNISETKETVIIEQEDGSIVTMTPLEEDEIAALLEYAENVNQPRLTNEVYAAPVRVNSDCVGVEFTNNGFILDFVDYVETNLIIWHAEDDNPVGYRISYFKLPAGTHRAPDTKYVANWHKAQTIGGYYIDAFGMEAGIGLASGILYNYGKKPN